MHLRELIQELGMDRAYVHAVVGIDCIDLQGWQSDHAVFQTTIARIRPREIVEVGSWKGASAIHMTTLARQYHPDVTTVCVDTFLGSNEILWTNDEFKHFLTRDEYQFPNIYRQFLYNVAAKELIQNIFPLPMTSSCGAMVLRKFNVRADLIYIDAGHEEIEVKTDLMGYWDILRPGGVMFGDDYAPFWSGVVRAVDDFARDQNVSVAIDDGKWVIEKPTAGCN